MRTIQVDLVTRRLRGEAWILELYPIVRGVACPVCGAESGVMCFWPEGDAAAPYILHPDRIELFYRARNEQT